MTQNHVDLFFVKHNSIKRITASEAVEKLYYIENNVRLPTKQELIKHKSKYTLADIKYNLASSDNVIPLYDIFTANLYLIQKRNVYARVIHDNYRFPDKLILDEIKQKRVDILIKIETYPKLKKDEVFIRKLRKMNLMITFMACFDNKRLFDTYINIFYRYSPELVNGTYTCLRKSFMPHKHHLKPYYTRDEVIKLGMNMGVISIPSNIKYIDFKESLSVDKYNDICTIIQKNDISANNLVEHQNYIINNNMVGLVQYYTIQGSYYMNQYMRGITNYSYKNEYLENNIKHMWDTVLNAPSFDKDYILYRFVETDNHLKHLKIGDIFVDNGFTSTTRDPFYRTDIYKFGFILIKIRIPKNTLGVGLCLETLSHFPAEEEIILAPMCNLKLISKDKKCEYYHPDDEFISNVKTRYEFKWICNGKKSFPKRSKYDQQTNIIDFMNLSRNNSSSLRNKIDHFIYKYCDPMDRIKCTIGNKTFYVVAEFYDSSSVYKDMYALKIADGFSLYSIYNGYILFMIEIGNYDGFNQIHINYFTKYSQLKRNEIMGDNNFIDFIAGVAYYFDISNVYIYADHISCDHKQHISKKLLSRQIKKYRNIVTPIINRYGIIDKRDNRPTKKQQRSFIKSDTKIYKPKQDNNTKSSILDDKYSGGSYCVDYYIYLKHNVKRYNNNKNLINEIQPKFSYGDIDLLKNISPDTILKKSDRDEIYQIYNKNYKIETTNEKHTIADFLIWMIDNKCYLIDILVAKFDRIYKNNNPFKKDYYFFDVFGYLYNKGIISCYNKDIKLNIDINHSLINLPRNRYTIRR